MAAKRWMVLPGGRPKKWKAKRYEWLAYGSAPKWYRSMFFEKPQRKKWKQAIQNGDYDSIPKCWSWRGQAGWSFW